MRPANTITQTALVILMSSILCAYSATSHAQALKKRVYRTKVLPDSFITESWTKKAYDSIIVKFSEGTRVRSTDHDFLVLDNQIGSHEKALLSNADLNIPAVQSEVSRINQQLASFAGLTIQRLFTRDKAVMDQEQKVLEQRVKEELADLNLYFLLVVKGGTGRTLLSLLLQSAIVENAYPVYRVANAELPKSCSKRVPAMPPVDSRDYTARQRYLNAAPLGIDARHAWTIPGGRGEGIRVVDVEYQWDLSHEDLKAPFWYSDPSIDSHGDSLGDHGTAVVGEMMGKHNRFGISGICPNAAYGLSGVQWWQQVEHYTMVSVAIDEAAAQLRGGDVLLIEQHTPGPSSGGSAICNPEQFEYVPMEYYQDCFDAIRRATARGIIVVEAAGNGEVNLDASIYDSLFIRLKRDSKALMVAGDDGGNGVPACWTNHGSRIDFFGWGDQIVTSGYGDLVSRDTGLHKKYTRSFGGTSGASPIVAGAIVSLQGIRRRHQLPLWTADAFRQNMIGVPQTTNTDKPIGRMPNLKATIRAMRLPKLPRQ